MSKFERRTITIAELRTVDGGGDKLSIEGLAAAYNVLSHDLGGFRERIDKGAFRSAIESNPDCVCLLNHDPNVILGRTTAGTLQVSDGPDGLRFRCDLPKTRSDVHESIKRGDINACSFSFIMSGDKSDQSFNEITDPEDRSKRVICRTIHRIGTLMDVSPCVFPAYPQGTHVDARALSIAPFVITDIQIPSDINEAAANAHNSLVRRRRDLLNHILS